jgi:predicted metal-dependent HD superfamily phosphohydrolase
VDTIQHRARCEEAMLVLDLDLLRLAAPPAEFERYSRELLQERRAFFPIQDDVTAWRDFCRQRRPFFEKMLARRVIYKEPAVYAALEQPARVNLRTSLQIDALEPMNSNQGIG